MTGTEANRLIEQHQQVPYPHDGPVRPTSCPICRVRYLDDLAHAFAADVIRVIQRWEAERMHAYRAALADWWWTVAEVDDEDECEAAHERVLDALRALQLQS